MRSRALACARVRAYKVAKTCYPFGPVVCRSLLGVVLATASLPGCGRRATAADCQLIVDRSVELQSKEMSENDPSAIKERERRIRAELEDQIKECESRRVTDKTMSCVRAAATTKELEACLQ